MFIGMTPEQGINTGDQIETIGNNWIALLNNTLASVDAAQWVGEDRDKFVMQCRSVVTKIEQTAALVKNHGAKLKQESQQQIMASAAK